MASPAEHPSVVAYLARTVASTVPANYTGKVTITLHYHRGTLARATSTREEALSAD
jgi:hypothetical protein